MIKKNIFLHLTIFPFFLIYNLSFAQCSNESLDMELDAFISNQMSLHNLPGLSAAIVKNGQVVWNSCYGYSSIEENKMVNAQTKFTLASISKLFTSTACIQLWEEGLIDLDIDINNYLPIEVINPNHPNIPITIRQLLQHKSSLRDYESDLDLWDNIGNPLIDLETFCASYFVQGGSFFNISNFGQTPPGTSSYWYSNAGFTLLGYIVQSVSGIPFNQYCQQFIHEPLEMNTCSWFYLEEDNVAMPYSNSLQPFGLYSVPEYPAAMLKSNIVDLSQFLIAITQKGIYNSFELIDQVSFLEMLPTTMTNGLGWWGQDTWYGDPNGDYWSHGGYMNGIRTQLNYYPSDSTGFIILTNGEGNYSQIQNKLEEFTSYFQIDDCLSYGCTDNIAVNYNIEALIDDGTCIYESIGIHETKIEASEQVKIIDILGREQKEHKKGSLLFYIYENGEVEKKVIN